MVRSEAGFFSHCRHEARWLTLDQSLSLSPREKIMANLFWKTLSKKQQQHTTQQLPQTVVRSQKDWRVHTCPCFGVEGKHSFQFKKFYILFIVTLNTSKIKIDMYIADFFHQSQLLTSQGYVNISMPFLGNSIEMVCHCLFRNVIPLFTFYSFSIPWSFTSKY